MPDRGQTPNHGSANARKHFGLSGPSVRLDRRINAVRADIADVALAGVLFAPHYARPMERRCIVAKTSLHAKPSKDAEKISELLHGEAFQIIEVSGGWAWGYCAHDHYVGYILAEALDTVGPGEWRVIAAKAKLVGSAEQEAGVIHTFSMGAIVTGVESGGFVLTDEGAIDRAALAPVTEKMDPVTQAEKLIGAPYQLGGRSSGGIDCSGLVQIALSFAGINAQRDSDLQAMSLGTPLPDESSLRRGDIVFFPGHVGMMTNGESVIHANSHSMNVIVEPLAALRTRLAENDISDMKARRP